MSCLCAGSSRHTPRTRHELTAAVGTYFLSLRSARRAERAFIRANESLSIARKSATASLTSGFHLQMHGAGGRLLEVDKTSIRPSWGVRREMYSSWWLCSSSLLQMHLSQHSSTEGVAPNKKSGSNLVPETGLEVTRLRRTGAATLSEKGERVAPPVYLKLLRKSDARQTGRNGAHHGSRRLPHCPDHPSLR